MRVLRYWSPTVLWMMCIYYFSSQSSVQVSHVYAIQFMVFKTLHLIEYMTLYILSYRSLRNTNMLTDRQNRYNAFLIALMYAITDEVHQLVVPTREGRLRDVGIDLIGISFAAFCIWKLLPKVPKRLKMLVKILELA